MKKMIAALMLIYGLVASAVDTKHQVKDKSTVTLAFAGDVMMGTNYPAESKGAYLPSDGGVHLFDDVRDVLRSADVAAANLEGTLFDEGGKPKACSDPSLCYTFRTPASYAGNLIGAGFDFMSVANNHVNDFGPQGLLFTQQNLKKAGIAYAGLREQCPTAIIERGGKKIGFAAFAHNRGTLNIMNPDEVCSVVEGLDKECDIVVVSFHGGGEGPKYTHVPHGMEVCFGEKRGDVAKFARAAIDAGADIVYGHGPHVTRGMEVYNDRLIMYSLGNFCTPYRVNLKGISGHAPVVTVSVDGDGRFLSGKIHPFIQQRGIGPRKDLSGNVIRQMRNLSVSDFPKTHPVISEDGTITKK